MSVAILTASLGRRAGIRQSHNKKQPSCAPPGVALRVYLGVPVSRSRRLAHAQAAPSAKVARHWRRVACFLTLMEVLVETDGQSRRHSIAQSAVTLNMVAATVMGVQGVSQRVPPGHTASTPACRECSAALGATLHQRPPCALPARGTARHHVLCARRPRSHRQESAEI